MEMEGAWPDESMDAYVSMMIPKASGTRPHDLLRPITVLDVVYCMWASSSMSGVGLCRRICCLLSAFVFGFRSECSTLHMAQWAIFGTMREASISSPLRRCPFGDASAMAITMAMSGRHRMQPCKLRFVDGALHRWTYFKHAGIDVGCVKSGDI